MCVLICAYLRTKVSNIILTSFKQGRGNFTPTAKHTPRKATQIMVKTDCVKKKQQQQQQKTTQKQAFFDKKLSEKNGNPKEKWEFAKYLVMPIKVMICNFSVMEEKYILTYNTRLTSNIFKSFFSNLAGSFLIKPSNPLDKGNLQAVIICYSVFTISGNFSLRNTSEENILQIMENIESSKATVADKLSS